MDINSFIACLQPLSFELRLIRHSKRNDAAPSAGTPTSAQSLFRLCRVDDISGPKPAFEFTAFSFSYPSSRKLYPDSAQLANASKVTVGR
jgi:hypothetical protein